MFIAALFPIAKTWKNLNVHWQMNGLRRGTYNGILLSHKGKQNSVICSNMDTSRDSHAKWNKSERERQIPYDITYIWNLIYGTNEPIYRKKLIDMEYRFVVAKGEGERDGWEFGVGRCKL